MEIDEKYFKLLNLLIHDKRSGLNGIISELCVSAMIGGYMVYYRAYMTKTHANHIVFVSEFENGSIVFLQPFYINYQKEMLEEMAKRHEKAIKEFFGDKYRDDMIMRISEEERQKKIRQYESLTLGLENWDKVIEHKG